MTDSQATIGKCLCGQTQLIAEEVKKTLGACHCETCRAWGGGPLLAVDCGTRVSLTGEEQIGVFSSSEWADRGFCKQCGTHLFYRLKGNQQYIVPVGIFGDIAGIEFDHQVFIDGKPDYYTFANKTEDMTGEEMFAKFAPPAD